jgi:hypothetical protein
MQIPSVARVRPIPVVALADRHGMEMERKQRTYQCFGIKGGPDYLEMAHSTSWSSGSPISPFGGLTCGPTFPGPGEIQQPEAALDLGSH